ncbi:DUF202 domain-containing protein [Cellulomonas sp. zg-ZUI222]|uniref:DUF202 domain-containing protein n=1 Tax=Cellulomonas wangleii TaxID=2816956 RepID=A0ABX8D7M2_9CELL|nr:MULTISPECIES: DUF202 domain-containing protein [Cellulomonas]MBO0901013.1 DUF202 domain-containing protein [Cellulomonas sp. zg-ZUI22]MBO0921668.1 DUF202 domain-containing protein [Cellulomonas wangleii]MBO0925161.1 DUF202 domain-containing protein [Cellulomonas wangleii]QVI63435.1 DUF202 domain-containing protein [Cellulomonas wangleii]
MTSSLAAERTALAWRRTALGLVAGSVAAGRLLSEAWGVAAWGVAAAGTALAVVLLRAARRRRTGVHDAHPRTTAAARSVGRDPGGRLVTACAAALVLLGAAALVVVLTWGA